MLMEDAKREILAKVAVGTLSPEEAALELEELEAAARSAEAAATATATAGEVTRIRVVASMGSVTIVGDESVREAVAEGPHVATREGDAYVIESRDEDGTGFTFGSRVRFGFDLRERRLLVRMNPRLRLEVEVQAGTLVVRGIRAPIRANVQAGSTRLEDFTFPIDLDVQAGSVKARGRLTEGASRISCQAGSVRLDLDSASSVKIRAKTSLGRVSLPGVPVVTAIGSGGSQADVGAGVGTLDIDAELGSVQVTVDR
jgi:hypothetical protein